MSVFRGWLGEAITTFTVWLLLDKKTYRRLNNVIIPSKNGTSQIDHLLVSTFGVFIIETKNIRGWIFGSESQSDWTQVLYGKKYSFQNPLRQTFRQKKVLSEYLGLEERFIHPIVYFAGDCKFKTALPFNVMKSGLCRYIRLYKERVLSADDIAVILEKLDKLASDPKLTTKEHIKSLHMRHSSTTVCPTCGSSLVERTTKSGSNKGSKFLGCENYPRCQYTKNISP
ncbi:MAG: NERD domain-containing protein [Alphaproteobacteria bacterium]